MENSNCIPVFSVNLKKRSDRRAHIIKEFKNKSEFKLEVIEAVDEENGRWGLWKTITGIIWKMKELNLDYGIICEDDHYFTNEYNSEILVDCIDKCRILGAEVLLGGVSWFQGFVPYTEKICWIERFTGLQFFIVFKALFDKILEAKFSDQDAADLKIYEISKKVYLIHPFISKQKEFGYSDTTERNNQLGVVTKHFEKISNEISAISKLSEHYNSIIKNSLRPQFSNNFFNMQLPILAVDDLKPDKMRIMHFTNKILPKINIINLNETINPKESLSLDLILRSAARMELDFFIVTNGFTYFDSTEELDFLLSNICEANENGADCLCAGCLDFGQSFPITANLLWISSFSHSNFLIIFKSYYQQILQIKDEFTSQNIDYLLSKNTIYKMLLYPFLGNKYEQGKNNPKLNNKGEQKAKYIKNAFDYLNALRTKNN